MTHDHDAASGSPASQGLRFDPLAPWPSHVGYWALDPEEHARLARKRSKAASLLPKGAILALFSGDEGAHSVGRFVADPWLRDLCEFTEPGAALLFDGSAWNLFMSEPTRASMIWEGYSLGPGRSKEALGIAGRPLAEFEPAFAAAAASAGALAIDPAADCQASRACLRMWSAAGKARSRPAGGRSTIDAPSLLEPMRLIADAGEAGRMRDSAKIASLGHMSAWEAMFRAVAKMPLADGMSASAILSGDPGSFAPDWEVPVALGPLAKAMLASGLRAPLTERMLEGAFLGMCAACGADGMAYAPIVAAGENAVCLHWSLNRRRISDEDWVLMDMGCSYAGFASDLTRTVPANGSFSGLRGEVYRLLLDAQLAGIEEAVEGAAFDAPHQVCKEILADGLEEMGLLRREWADPAAGDEGWRASALSRLLPHSTSHFIGRAVHDVGARVAAGEPIPLAAGMRITVEPGLYFYPDLPGLPEELAGFGARIEDVCLIAQGGQPPEVLTALCPKDPETIEAFARSCGLLGGMRDA